MPWYPDSVQNEKELFSVNGILEKLGLTPDVVEKLDTIPYADLVKAGNEAIA